MSSPLLPEKMPKSMGPSLLLPWMIHALTFCTLFTILSADPRISYSNHCASFVPEASPDTYSEAISPLTQFHTGYYTGGSEVLEIPHSSSSSRIFTFLTRQVLKTDRDVVLKVSAELVLRVPSDGVSVVTNSVAFTVVPGDSLRQRRRSSVGFRLEGFWAESSGNLCMVGSSYSRGGEADPKLNAVLKLNNVTTSASITSLFTGSLHLEAENKDRIFKVSLLMFPQMNYNYTLVPEETSDVGPAKINLPAGLEPGDGRFCSIFQTVVYEFSLTYAADCNPVSKHCTPFGSQSLPPTMFLNSIDCSDGNRKELRVLLQFSDGNWDWYHGSFDLNTTLVGEGLWDEKENQVHIVACRVDTIERSPPTAVIEGCSISLHISFPATWSIRERNTMVGEIQSNKKPDDSGYFGKITARSTNNYVSEFPDLNYEYTEVQKVRKLCLEKKQLVNRSAEWEKYPDWYSRDMSFDMSVQTSRGKNIGSGYSYPIFVGNHVYERFAYDMPLYQASSKVSVAEAKSSGNSQFNISYSIIISRLNEAKFNSRASIFNGYDSSPQDRVVISAEGVYYTETGDLCMVGCRGFVNPFDCEILINLEFPPLGSKRSSGFIKGSIKSMREISDPLYFESLNIFAMAFYTVQTARSIWRLHLELALVLMTNTFSCIFVALQLLHVRKHPQVLPFASVLMLAILTLGHAVSLLLNFEALFQGNRYRMSFFLDSGRWLEVSEVLVRLVTLMTFLFEFRLLQLSFSATRDMNSWVAEKKALFFGLPLYAALALALLLLNLSSSNSIWGTLTGFVGLVLDGFLLPQILLNIFRNSNEKALSNAFYVGTSSIRLLPHLYDLWRNHHFVLIPSHFEGSYLYGSPNTDFYSTAWDVIVSLACLIFAAIIYLQQRFGGDCIIPQRFRTNSLAYEKVPEITDL